MHLADLMPNGGSGRGTVVGRDHDAQPCQGFAAGASPSYVITRNRLAGGRTLKETKAC